MITLRAFPGGGSSFLTTYNPDGTVQEQNWYQQPRTFYTYNSNGSVASVTRNYLGSGSIKVRWEYSYQDAAFPEKVTRILPKNATTGVVDPNWQEWRYDYHPIGSAAPGALHHVYRVRSDGTTIDTLTTYTYNSFGQTATVTDATGGVTTYGYDPTTGDLASVTYPKNSDSGPNPVYQYDRDPVGRVSAVTDPLGNISTYAYDGIDRVTSVTLPRPSLSFPLDFVTSYSYDNYDSGTGFVFTYQTDPNGHVTKQGYDQYGQLLQSIDALNQVTTFTYVKGLLSSITDANQNLTSYQYDVRRRLIKTVFPDGFDEDYTYYYDDLLKTKTDRKNQVISYRYDQLRRLITRCYGALGSGDSCHSSNPQINYTYVGQKLTTVTNTLASDTHTYAYDPAYRILSDTQGTRGTISYTYDPADRVASYSVQSGPSSTNQYYSDGSLKSAQWSAIPGQFAHNYTLNGQYNNVTFPNGQHRDYTYDNQGRLMQISNTDPVAGNLASYTYEYDLDNSTGQLTMLGQRTKLVASVPSQGFSNSQTKYYYDQNHQLNRTDYPNVAPFSGEVHSWSYDAIGNRLTNTVNSSTQNYSYFLNGGNPNNGQRLQSDGVNNYTYDNNGNSVTKSGPGGNYTFTWNKDDRMTAMAGAEVATYTYDYIGRRTSKTVGGTTVTYLYNGQNLVGERGGFIADYLFGPGIDEPLATTRSGSTYYYNADGLGSATIVNDPAGTVQNKYVFDAWGVTRSQTSPVANPFGYTSREFAEAGSMYYRARYYQPSIGKFIGEDQMRFNGGFNFYTYVENKPVLFADPFGLKCCPKSISVKCTPVFVRNAKQGYVLAAVGVVICAKAQHPEDCEFLQSRKVVRYESGGPPPLNIFLGEWKGDPEGATYPPSVITKDEICMVDTPGWTKLPDSDMPAVMSVLFVTRVQDKVDPNDYVETQWGITISCSDPAGCGFGTACH